MNDRVQGAGGKTEAAKPKEAPALIVPIRKRLSSGDVGYLQHGQMNYARGVGFNDLRNVFGRLDPQSQPSSQWWGQGGSTAQVHIPAGWCVCLPFTVPDNATPHDLHAFHNISGNFSSGGICLSISHNPGDFSPPAPYSTLDDDHRDTMIMKFRNPGAPAQAGTCDLAVGPWWFNICLYDDKAEGPVALWLT